MVQHALSISSARAALSTACSFTLAALLAGLSPSACLAAAEQGQDVSALARLENRLFFTSYSHDSLAARLDRLEKRVFGEIVGGSNEERLARLVASQNAPLNPEAIQNQAEQAAPVSQPVDPEQALPAATFTLSGQECVARPPVGVERREAGVQPAGNEPDEQDCAIERARVAVEAAKDEEIKGLLADAVALWRAQRAQEAIEKFEQVIRLDPQNAQAHFSMGIIEESHGNYAEALSSYKQASQANPANKDYREAVQAVERKLNSKQAAVGKRSELTGLAEQATAAYKRGEYLSALDLYKRLDQKVPNQALVKYNIGTIYLVMRQPEEALGYYRQARKLNPREERYARAYEELQATLHKDEELRRQNENAIKQQSRFNTFKPEPAPGNQGAMASFGILGKSSSEGVTITTIGIASKAAQAGLQRGDIIKAVDGTIVKSTGELNEILSRRSPEQPVQLMVQRARRLAQVAL